jgi:hypothetical protein
MSFSFPGNARKILAEKVEHLKELRHGSHRSCDTCTSRSGFGVEGGRGR